MADDAARRAVRLKALTYVEATFEPVPIDAIAAREWARLVSDCRRARRRVPVNDLWIAASAIARDVGVLTQDADYDGIPGLRVLKA